MSLISDGLKKAHLDALRQDREQRRQFLSPGRVDVPAGGSNVVAIATAASASAIVAAVVAIYFVRSVQPPAPAPVAVTAQRPAPVLVQPSAVAVTQAPPKVAPNPRSLSAARDGAIPAVKGTVSSLVPLDAPPARERERVRKPVEREVAPVEREVAPVKEATPKIATPAPTAKPAWRTASRDRFVNGETYASPINAPGGMEITLSGISSARGESVAIMNGNVIRVGSAVGPFTVEKIERGRVQLKYIDVHIWMTY